MSTSIPHATETKSMFRWEMLGFGVCQAWIVSHLFFSHASASSRGVVYTLFLYVGLALTALLIAIRARRADAVLRSDRFPPYPVVASLTGCIGSALAVIGSTMGSPPYVSVGLVLVGFCGAFYEVSWGRFYAELPSAQVWLNTLLSMLVAALLNLMVSLLPLSLFFPASAAQLAFATVSIISISRKSDIGDFDPEAEDFSAFARSDKRIGDALLRFSVVCLIYPFIHMCTVSLGYASLDPTAVSDARSVANVVVSLALLVAFLAFRSANVMTLFKLVLPVTAAGLLAQLLLPPDLGHVAIFIVCGGNKLFSILSFILLIEYLHVTSLVTVQPFAILVVAKNAGLFLGSVVSACITALLEANGLDHSAFVSVLVILLIVCFFWIFSEKVLYVPMQQTLVKGKAAGEQNAFVSAPIVDNATGLARARGLTPRETEVLALLARGKNRAAIMDELCISQGTAHAHITHVYQKIGVHSQQELIRMVENPIQPLIQPLDQPGLDGVDTAK